MKKNPVGRPTLLTPELKEKARRYIFDFEEQGDVIPSAAGLACWLGVSKSTIYLYGEKDSDFSDTLDAIQTKQESLTLNRGMTGVFNSTIAKLVLANHGYSDKVQQEHTSPDGSMSPTRIVIEAASKEE